MLRNMFLIFITLVLNKIYMFILIYKENSLNSIMKFLVAIINLRTEVHRILKTSLPDDIYYEKFKYVNNGSIFDSNENSSCARIDVQSNLFRKPNLDYKQELSKDSVSPIVSSKATATATVSDVKREYVRHKRELRQVLATKNRDSLLRIAHEQIYKSGVSSSEKAIRFKKSRALIYEYWPQISCASMKVLNLCSTYSTLVIDIRKKRIYNEKFRVQQEYVNNIANIDEILASYTKTKMEEAEDDPELESFARFSRSSYDMNIKEIMSDSEIVAKLHTLHVPHGLEDSSCVEKSSDVLFHVFDDSTYVRDYASRIDIIETDLKVLFDGFYLEYEKLTAEPDRQS